MKLKYSPSKSDVDTNIEVLNNSTITIDGELFEFDEESILWEDIFSQTNGKIIEAHREDGELFITVFRKYSTSCTEWDTGDYHEVDR